MPKVYLTPIDKRRNKLRGVIVRYQTEQGVNNLELAEILDFSKATLYLKLKTPDKLTLNNWTALHERLEIPWEDIIKAATATL